MLYIYLPVLYYHGNLYVTEEAYPGRRGFPLSQRSFLLLFTVYNVKWQLQTYKTPLTALRAIVWM